MRSISAIKAPGLIVSYGDLADKAMKIAGGLQRLGITDGEGVGLLTSRTADAIAAMLGILACGAHWLPLDPRNPIERNIRCLNDVGCRMLLVDEVSQPGYDAEIETHLLSKLKTSRAIDQWAIPEPEALAYSIFTSGSSGMPKRVAINHEAAANLMDWALDTFGQTGLKRTLCSTPFSFDVSIFEIFATLSAGGCLELVPSILSLADLPDRNQLTLIAGVPSAMAALMRFDVDMTGIEEILLAGEATPPGLVQKLFAAGAKRVWNLYGPTEDTVYSTAQPLTSDTLADVSRYGDVPIGVALPGHVALVLDQDGHEMAPHVVGELCLMGVGLASPPHPVPGARPEAHRVDRFEVRHGERLYRTGDRAWKDDGGSLHFAGRLDDQIKWRGFRIEPQEITHAICQVPGVLRAEVRLCPCTAGQIDRAELVAWVMASTEEDHSALDAEIRKAVTNRLPEWMRPSKFRLVDTLPLGRHDKLDRRALLHQQAALG
nr:AMP-binding protein [Rhizobium sp. FKY42]